MPAASPIDGPRHPGDSDDERAFEQNGFERGRGFERHISAGHGDTAHLHAAEYHEAECEPTTMAIPGVGGGESVVIEPEQPAFAPGPSDEPRAPLRARLALATLALAAFAISTNEASIVALSPLIAAGLDVPLASIGLLATAFALTVVALAIPLTLATSRLNKRVVLTATFAVWTAGLVAAASATGLPQLMAGRVTSAAAHALFWAVVAPTAAAMFAPHLRAKIVTRILVGAAAAGVVGTPLVTLAGSHVGWQAPYWALAGLGLLLAVALALVVPGRARGGDPGHQDHTKGDLPSRRDFVRVLVVAFTATVGMAATWTYIVPFYTDTVGFSLDAVPVLFAVGGVVSVAATLVVARFLASHVVRSATVGLSLLIAAWLALATAMGWAAVLAHVAQAAGWSILLAALLNWAMRHTPFRTEVGASIYTVTVNAGAAVGPTLGAITVANWGTAALPLLSLAFTLVAVAAATGFSPSTLRQLTVPRRVRMAVQARFARLERHDWNRRAIATVTAPVTAARLVAHHSARVGTATGRGVIAASSRTGRTVVVTSARTGRQVAKATATAGRTALKAGVVARKGAAAPIRAVTKRGSGPLPSPAGDRRPGDDRPPPRDDDLPS